MVGEVYARSHRSRSARDRRAGLRKNGRSRRTPATHLSGVPCRGGQAQHYRDHTARLRELACAAGDVVVRRRLISLAIRFEELADELERRAADSPTPSNA